MLLATGPSLNQRDVDFLRFKHVKVFAINDAYRLAPWADALYACDAKWWDTHFDSPAMRAFHGPKFTHSAEAAAKYKLHHVPGASEPGLSPDPSYIHLGGNSGYQTLDLAVKFGAREIILLGYDMQTTWGKSHFFGDHPDSCRARQAFDRWIELFATTVPDLKRLGITVLNASRESALDCFPRARLEDLF